MHPKDDDSGSMGILIGVLIGGLLLVALLAVGFLFLGATRYGGSAPITAPSASPAAVHTPSQAQQSPDDAARATEAAAEEE